MYFQKDIFLVYDFVIMSESLKARGRFEDFVNKEQGLFN